MIKLVDSNKFYLQGTQKRFLHLASVHYGVKEFMAFADRFTQQIYIEEVTGGTSPQLITDDALFRGLHDFLLAKGLLAITPLLSDQEWLRNIPEH